MEPMTRARPSLPAVAARFVPWSRVWVVFHPARKRGAINVVPFPTKPAATAYLAGRPGVVVRYDAKTEKKVTVRGFRP